MITIEIIKNMKPEEAVAAYIEAKEITSTQGGIQRMIKAQYLPMVTASQGRYIAYVDAASIAHGFELFPTKSTTMSKGKTREALAKRGIAAAEIEAIVAESMGNSNGSFGAF